jgi:hypothetical protein
MTLTIESYDSYAVAAQEDRCSPRTIVKIAASLRRSGDRPFNVVMRDISVAGFSCEAVTSMRPGARCWLNLTGLEGQLAEVMWNDGTVVGCAFSNLLSSAVLDRILDRHGFSPASRVRPEQHLARRF